jgi:hypothetical protein
MRAGAVCVVIAALLFSAALQAQNVGSAPAAERLDQLQTALRKPGATMTPSIVMKWKANNP